MSAETIHRCAVCHCYLDDEDLFCSNCGTENPYLDTESLSKIDSYVEQHSYDCQSCGASMSYDASAQSLRCPFCGSSQMKEQQARRTIQSDWVVPLVVTATQAEQIFRQWLGSGFWRPSDAADAAQIGKISAVYLPFWVIEAHADTKWTADSSPAPPGCRGDWYPVSGENHASHRDILVGASSILTTTEVDAITPFDLRASVRPSEFNLDLATVEMFRMPRKLARPHAQAIIQERERQICSKYVPGRSRRVKVNVRIHGMVSRPVLLPVWILAYHYKQQLHRVLINGQTGKISGSAPFSYAKLVVVIATVGAAVLFLLIVLAMLASR